MGMATWNLPEKMRYSFSALYEIREQIYAGNAE